MDSRSLVEQEKDIKDLLRRAERTPVKTSALRRDTLKRLIDLAHSPHSSLKIIAATNFKLFIKDFPDLEDEAINAVYDLCEDPVSSVRIKGYAAIVDVSREQQKWVKRNADVLVQLLQSDEPEEVTFVKRALTQHLDMDPSVTLGVLCDQIVPPDEPLDEEEQSIRDRLRSLVIAFLAGEARRSLVERHASTPGSPAEEVLVSGLFRAIAKLSSSDADVIVKDILAPLPSFRPPSPRGKELLDVLLTQARALLKSNLPSGAESGSLQDTRYYLDLASFITVERHLAPASHLLHFYYSHLTPKLVLGRLSDDDQAYVIGRVAETFAACDDVATRTPPMGPSTDVRGTRDGFEAADGAALRKQFPDICSVLLQVFADMTSPDQRPWPACYTLLQGLVRRVKETRWHIPQNIISSLRRIEALTAPQDGHSEARAAQEQARSVIRSLLEPVKSPVTPTTQANTLTPGGKADGLKGNVPTANANGTTNGAHRNGIAGAPRGDQRRIMNVNKRKVDAPNGPAPAAPSSPSGSRNTTVPASQGGPRHGLPAPPASLPPRPVTGAASTSTGAATTTPLANRQGDRQAPPHIKDRLAPSPKPIAATGEQPTNGSRTSSGLSAGPDVDDSVQRSSKRARTDGQRGGRSDAPPMQSVWSVGTPSTEEPHPAPSLLSRLNSGSLNGKAPSGPLNEREQPTRGRGGQGVRNRGEVERGRNVTDAVVPAKRRAELTTPSTAEPPVMASDSAAQSVSTRSHQSQLPPDPDRDPIGGYSIRGAAKAAKRSSPAGSDSVGTKVAATSLLHRLQPLGEQGAGQGSDEGGGKRPRKKGRHA